MKRPNLTAPRVLTAPVRSDRPLQAVSIDGHLQRTRNAVWGWYRLGEPPWQYRGTDERQGLLDRIAYAYSTLAGRAIRIRVSTRPEDADRFAADLDERTIDPLPGPEWKDYVNRQRDRIDEIDLVETVAIIGIRLSDKPVKDLSAVNDDDAQVLAALAAPGLNARPVTEDEMEWLLYRSTAPGCPLPGGPRVELGSWGAQDLGAITDSVTWEAAPFDRTVQVIAWRGTSYTQSWAVTLTFGRMADRNFPEDDGAPFLAAAARQAFPVDVVLSGTIHQGRDLAEHADKHRRYAEDNRAHMIDHGQTPPASMERTVVRAAEVHDELTGQDKVRSSRFKGVIRLVVTGATRDEAVSRARRLQRDFGEDQRIELVWTMDQASILRELIPGEPWAKVGYQRQMSAPYLAAAVPNVTGRIGTPVGMYLGYTSGDTPLRPVYHDGHWGIEVRNESGLIPVLGSLGAGKSALLGRIMYGSAMAGVATCALDPSGPLAKLTEMPEMKRWARHVDLTTARPGILDPRRLLPMPVLDDGWDHDEFEAARGRCISERIALTVDVLRMLLPTSLRTGETDAALDEAVTAADSNPWATIFHLRENGATAVARHLEIAAGGYARLMFPARLADGSPDPRSSDHDPLDYATLVVITMTGMHLPEVGAPPDTWSSEERVAAAVLHLAAFYARRFVYSRPRTERKLLVVDEAHWLARWPSGAAWMRGLTRDTRKYDIELLIGSQHPRDLQRLDPEGDAFTGGAFIGRQEKLSVAEACLTMLGLPATKSHQQAIQSLCEVAGKDPIPGEFLHVDATGATDRIRVDIKDVLPELFEALYTTPDGHR